MHIGEVIGANLRRAREQRGQSQAEFGAWLGKSLGSAWKPQTVSAAEKGRRQFAAADLVALAYVLEVPVAHLLTPPDDVETVTAGTVEVPASALAPLPAGAAGDVDPRLVDWSFRAVGMGGRWIRESTAEIRQALDRIEESTEFQVSRAEVLKRAARGESLEGVGGSLPVGIVPGEPDDAEDAPGDARTEGR